MSTSPGRAPIALAVRGRAALAGIGFGNRRDALTSWRRGPSLRTRIKRDRAMLLLMLPGLQQLARILQIVGACGKSEEAAGGQGNHPPP